MTNMQMYEYAKQVIMELEHVQPEDRIQPDVLWAGGMLEIRRAVVWFGEKMYMVNYNSNTEVTTVDTYEKTAQ